MNQSQIHLALTHLPVILTITGLVVLAISIFIKNTVVTRVSFYILAAAGLFAIPVFFTGEGAEETIEHLPGVSESIIEQHENLANISIYIVLGTAFLALAGLFSISGKPLLNKARYFVLFAAIFSSGFMTWTAHLGGQIRHTELSSALVQNDEEKGNTEKNENANNIKDNGKIDQEDDD
jgi:uncharacterized membrane protein